MTDFTELKRKHRVTWASGEYDQIARGIRMVADHVVRCARVRAGERGGKATRRTYRSRTGRSMSSCRPAGSCSRPTSSVWPTKSRA
jgi:hypothetical protein